MSKLTVISGCPRSGTSIMSLCIRKAIGTDALIGSAFPQELRRRPAKDTPEDVRDYYDQKTAAKNEAPPEYKDMNPDGFWECRYTVNGVRWHEGMPDLSGKYAKIVSQGIAASNPAYVGRIVCMARDPRQVAKSQERLKRPDLPEETIVHSPEMFIRVTCRLAGWILRHDKAADVLIVNYDELIASAPAQLRRVADFLELPLADFDPSVVKPSLKRSAPESLDHHLWPVADAIYAALLRGDWAGILAVAKDQRNTITRDNVATNCERLGERMFYAECVNCIHNTRTAKSFKARAAAKGIDWKTKPCMFLCHTAPDFPRVPLQQTIDENHWRDDADDFTPPTITEKASMALGTLGRVIAAAASGRKVLARRDVIDARRATCESCPLLKMKNDEPICRACTCNVTQKVRVAQSTCPKERWPQ